MKKFFTTKNILLLVGLALTLVAFFVAFGAGLSMGSDQVKGLIIGKPTFVIDGVVKDATKPWDARAGLSLVGLLLVVAAAVVCGLVGFISKKNHKGLFIFMAIVMFVGAILIFLLQLSMLIAVASKYKSYAEQFAKTLDRTKLNACTVISAIAAIASGVLMIVSRCVKDKE